MSELKFGCVEHLRWIRKHMAPQDDEHKVKPCPFCGDMPASMKAELDGKKRYGCKNCTPNLWYTPERWNTRRIEDALNARIAELEAENAALKAKLNAGETVDEWGKPDWVGKDVRK